MGGKNGGINWSVLWKSDDWMSVWVGFLILAVFLAGFTMALPGWKWVGDGSFQDKIAGWTAKTESLAKEAEGKNEAALKDQAAALKTALDAKDRKAIVVDVNYASAIKQPTSAAAPAPAPAPASGPAPAPVPVSGSAL